MTNKEALLKAVEIAGGQAALARRIGVSSSALNQWLRGVRPVPPERAALIERETCISRSDICPDFPW